MDVEEHLYGLAKQMGITFVTSSQVRLLVVKNENLKFCLRKFRELRAAHKLDLCFTKIVQLGFGKHFELASFDESSLCDL